MLKLKLQYAGHLIWRADLFEKTLMLGKIEGRRRRGWQRMRWLDGIIDSTDMSWVNSGSWWWTRRPGVLQFMWSQRVGHNWATKLNWTDLGWIILHRMYRWHSILSVHPSMATWLLSTSWLLWTWWYEHRCANIYSCLCFQLFGVYTHKWNCGVLC